MFHFLILGIRRFQPPPIQILQKPGSTDACFQFPRTHSAAEFYENIVKSQHTVYPVRLSKDFLLLHLQGMVSEQPLFPGDLPAEG